MHPAHAPLAENRMRSAPSLHATGAEMTGPGMRSVVDTTELTHPLSVEIKRWQGFSEFSRKEMEKGGGFKLMKDKPTEEPKKLAPLGGLVNFPKYMLIHNCHLKNQDQIRFVEDMKAQRVAADEAARNREEFGEETQMSGHTQDSQAMKKVASWGQPMRYKTAEERNAQWAGNPMPQGRGCRTSNPFSSG